MARHNCYHAERSSVQGFLGLIVCHSAPCLAVKHVNGSAIQSTNPIRGVSQVSVRPLKELVEELHLGKGRTNQNFIVARLIAGNPFADVSRYGQRWCDQSVNETFVLHFSSISIWVCVKTYYYQC